MVVVGSPTGREWGWGHLGVGSGGGGVPRW